MNLHPWDSQSWMIWLSCQTHSNEKSLLRLINPAVVKLTFEVSSTTHTHEISIAFFMNHSIVKNSFHYIVCRYRRRTPRKTSEWLWLRLSNHLFTVNKQQIAPGVSCSSFVVVLQYWHQRYSDLCIWLWWGQSRSMANRRLRLTYDDTSPWRSAYSARPHVR